MDFQELRIFNHHSLTHKHKLIYKEKIIRLNLSNLIALKIYLYFRFRFENVFFHEKNQVFIDLK